MRLDQLIQNRDPGKKLNIPVETWVQTLEVQKKILAANRLPETMTIQWQKTEEKCD